jgi:hypothetical protein
MTEPTLHPRKQLLFALLSAADFALTWWLIETPDAQTYEANPVAAWWLARFGWHGLACFKAAAACLVLALATVIARRRPLVASRLLRLGCLCLAAVVAYSTALAGTDALGREDAATTVARVNEELEDVNRGAREEYRRKEPFRALMEQLVEEINAERCTLAEAVERLMALQGRDPDLLRTLEKFYPDLPAQQQFACWLVCRAVRTQGHDVPAARRLASRLDGEFQSAYGARPPAMLRGQLLGLWPAASEDAAALARTP